jgi:hypothetical protein
VADQVNQLGRVDAVTTRHSGLHIMRSTLSPVPTHRLIDRPSGWLSLSGMPTADEPTWPAWTGADKANRLSTANCSSPPLRRCCPHLARCVQQRRRPRLGAHKNGRARCSRRPSARAPDPGMAGHQ